MTLGIHTLKSPKGSRHRGKRRGSGDSAGQGSFSGRGGKGQTARTGGRGGKRAFEGGQTPLVQSMPKLKGFTNPNRRAFQVVNLSDLNRFENGATVNLVSLFERNLISKKTAPVKVLGSGTLKKKLTVAVDAASGAAKQGIESAGGTLKCAATGRERLYKNK